MATNSQSDLAVRLYEPRGPQYDDSWHPSFTKRILEYLDISSGDQILDLACGTGLLSFLEGDAVGPNGRVVGVDITPSMLARARFRKSKENEKYSHVEFHEGDIMKLDEIDAVKGQTFDFITLASALVLFPDPNVAVRYWAKFLKPGGAIVLDSTHPHNLIFGILIERTARRLGVSVPYHRNWSTSEADLKFVLRGAGLDAEKVVTIDNQAGYGRRYYAASEADRVFDENIVKGDATTTFADGDLKERARSIFREEWNKLVVDGKVEEVDAVFLGIARKPSEAHDNNLVFSGGCRCKNVKYEFRARLSSITLCYCRACRQLSGSAYIPFAEVPTSAFEWTASSQKQTLQLSDAAERTFCSGCGSPITMTYSARPDLTSIVLSSVDEETYTAEWPKVARHIYVKEKAPWTDVPDDDAQKFEAGPSSHLA